MRLRRLRKAAKAHVRTGDAAANAAAALIPADPSAPPDGPCARGKKLHSQVPAEHWCVTRQDLDNFVEIVRGFHERGEIPNDPDPVSGELNRHHDDPAIGPNIHAVNRYVIKPTTLAKGGMSWALMLHEDGLPVHFFATHNWQEGIYEFYHKVTESWPPGAEHLWCCFLANPQPWERRELKELLGSEPDLSDSPFARALNAPSCQMLLAVPNVTESIYTRLWCVEEARRAITLNMPVWLATDAGILGWPHKCQSIDEASRIMSSLALRRSRARGYFDVIAIERAEKQIAADFVSVRQARCSDSGDERRIKAWVQGQEDEIDAMIRRLARTGHWVPRDPRSNSSKSLLTTPTSRGCDDQTGRSSSPSDQGNSLSPSSPWSLQPHTLSRTDSKFVYGGGP